MLPRFRPRAVRRQQALGRVAQRRVDRRWEAVERRERQRSPRVAASPTAAALLAEEGWRAAVEPVRPAAQGAAARAGEHQKTAEERVRPAAQGAAARSGTLVVQGILEAR